MIYLKTTQAANAAFSHLRRRVLMEVTHLLALSDDLRIDQCTITASALVLEVVSTHPVC
jgi:hypothetical protein